MSAVRPRGVGGPAQRGLRGRRARGCDQRRNRCGDRRGKPRFRQRSWRDGVRLCLRLCHGAQRPGIPAADIGEHRPPHRRIDPRRAGKVPAHDACERRRPIGCAGARCRSGARRSRRVLGSMRPCKATCRAAWFHRGQPGNPAGRADAARGLAGGQSQAGRGADRAAACSRATTTCRQQGGDHCGRQRPGRRGLAGWRAAACAAALGPARAGPKARPTAVHASPGTVRSTSPGPTRTSYAGCRCGSAHPRRPPRRYRTRTR